MGEKRQRKVISSISHSLNNTKYKVSTIPPAYIKSWHNSNITCSQDKPDSSPELDTSYLDWNDFFYFPQSFKTSARIIYKGPKNVQTL